MCALSIGMIIRWLLTGTLKTDCQKRQAEAQLSLSAAPQIMCKPNGSYSEIQCDKSTKECWCVDLNGDEILGTRTLGLLKCSSTGERRLLCS